MKDILCKTIDLDNLPEEGYAEFVGITDLKKHSPLVIKDVEAARGEFAGFLIEDQKVIIFRDRIGGRSIYYGTTGRKLYVSNRIEWIADQMKPGPDIEYIKNDYLQFQIPFGTRTFFSGITRLMPGHYSINGQQAVRYWKPIFGDEPFRPAYLLDLLNDAVKFREEHAQAPRTAYLSGGVDSSSISVLSNTRIVFSGFYDEKGYSERDYIESVSDRYKMEVNERQITEKNFYSVMENLLDVNSNPQCGLGVIPQVIVAQEAAKAGFAYAFTGEGGDEIFCGYNWNTIVFAVLSCLRGLIRDRYMVRYDPMTIAAIKKGVLPFTAGLIGRGNDLMAAVNMIEQVWVKDQAPENNIFLINLLVGLPSILEIDERVGQYADIMPISPIIDHKIVEYICSIRPTERDGIPKYMLRQAMGDLLPEKVRNRYEKMGFPVPYEKWEWPMLRNSMESLKKRGIFSTKEIDQVNTMDRQAWAFYNIELMFQRFFK